MVFDVARAFDRVGIGRAALELVEQRAVRLAHHLRQHVEPTAMRHADHDLLDAEIAAALDDLLQRRDQQFGAVEPEALGAGEFGVAELLEALGLDQLDQDRAPALAGEADFLVRSLDALLDPGLLRRIADVHELDAERLAIGALADRDDLAQVAVFEAKHVIEEDLAVEVGFREAVGARIELLAVARRLDAERIELGMEMTAHAVGADQHQRAHRVARRLMQVGRASVRRPWPWLAPGPWRQSCCRRPFRPRPSCRRAPRSVRRAARAANCRGPRTALPRSWRCRPADPSGS